MNHRAVALRIELGTIGVRAYYRHCGNFGMMNAAMPRPLRIHTLERVNHVMSRGNRRDAIFYSDADLVEFLRTLGQACLETDRLRIGRVSYVSNLLSGVDSKL